MAETDEVKRVRPFADFLADHNRGTAARKAAEQLQELVTAVIDTGKKGTVTVTVSVEPMKETTNDTLLTKVTVTSKLPQLPEKAAVFYADEDHNLVREDPQAIKFEGLKKVEAPALKGAVGSTLREGESVSVTPPQGGMDSGAAIRAGGDA